MKVGGLSTEKLVKLVINEETKGYNISSVNPKIHGIANRIPILASFRRFISSAPAVGRFSKARRSALGLP